LKKIACLLLALLTVACCFAACGDKAPGTVVEGTNDVVVTDEGAETLGIPLTADYGEYDFRVLSAGNQAFNDFQFEEESTLPLDNAQYKRKIKVEEDYNITITQDIQQKYSSGGGPGFLAVSQQANSGDVNYDLCLIAGYDVSVLAYNGYLYDMNAIEAIDLSKSWWDQNATESLSVNDVVFFTTGDITVSDNRTAFCLLFNKELLKDYNLESPYDLVHDGEWTLETFGGLVKSVSEDLNQDGVFDSSDRYGLMVWDDSMVGIVNAAGERCCTIDENGQIKLTFYNENTLSALEQYAAIAYDKQHAITYQRDKSVSGLDMWKNNQGLFWTTLVHQLPNIREMESDFGVLPYPKLNEEQDNYYTCIAPYNSQFICIPLIQNDVERTGVITEALAYYGQKVVLPALYDVTLVGQSTRDEESEPMLDIIFANLVYDIGYYYQIGPYNKQLIVQVRNFSTNFTSMYDTYKPAADATLKVINQYYAKAVADWQ